MLSFNFDQSSQITRHIIEQKSKLLLVAGASASGKTTFAEELVTHLTQSGKKVLLISSDNYYSNDSSLKYLLYGTFDHPGMIEYQLLADNIHEYLQTGKTSIPNYSFVEKRRTHLTEINEVYDIIIIEGLYTINQLSSLLRTHNPTLGISNIFVHADLEEIIFRRIIRDQKRIAEPIHTIIDVLSRVSPMRNVFGQTQQKISDIVIENTFSIMDKEGKNMHREILKILPSDITLTKKEYCIDYVYNDISNNNDCVIITEVYDFPGGILRKSTVSRNQFEKLYNNDYDTIAIDIYQPGIVISLHSLVQLAGLTFIEKYEKTLSYYHTSQGEDIIIKERGNHIYKLKQ